MIIDAPSYHAHVYFEPSDEKAIAELHVIAIRDLEGRAKVWPIRHRPVGPHPLPMFEIDVDHAHRDAVLEWLLANHGQHSVLIHPNTGNDLEDHRDHAVWLGRKLALYLSAL